MEGPEGFLLCQIVMDAPTKQFNCGNDKMFRTRIVDCKNDNFWRANVFFISCGNYKNRQMSLVMMQTGEKTTGVHLVKCFVQTAYGLVNLLWFDSKACGTSWAKPRMVLRHRSCFRFLFSGFSGCQGRQYFFCPKMRVIAALIFCVGLWQMAFVGRLGSS